MTDVVAAGIEIAGVAPPDDTTGEVPVTLVTWIKEMQVPTWGLLLTCNVLLLVVGCFLDPLSAILLLSPLLVPLVTAAGVDSVHFGIVVMVNLAIGLFHPPFGIRGSNPCPQSLQVPSQVIEALQIHP